MVEQFLAKIDTLQLTTLSTLIWIEQPFLFTCKQCISQRGDFKEAGVVCLTP